MPRLPARPCSFPGCGERLRGSASRCPAHPLQRRRDLRPSAERRGYDAAWRRARDEFLRQRGYRCMRCGSAPPPGQLHVHHRVALRRGGARLDPSNFEALCQSCHSRATRGGE